MDADKPVLLYFYEGEVAFEHMNNTKMSGIKRFKKKYADKMLFSPKAILSPEEIEGKLLMGLNFCFMPSKSMDSMKMYWSVMEKAGHIRESLVYRHSIIHLQ